MEERCARRSLAKRLILPAAAYAAVTAGVYHRVVSDPSRFVVGATDDAYAVIWQLWWFKHTLAGPGSSPFFTSLVEHPFGVGVSHMTIANHILALPLTAAWGPVSAYNLMILFSFVVSAMAVYLLVMELTGLAAAAFFSGAAFAFSPFHTVFSGAGGMDAAQVQYLPLVLLFLFRHSRTGSSADLALSLLSAVMAVFSFGYYAALAAVVIAVYGACRHALPAAVKAVAGPVYDDLTPLGRAAASWGMAGAAFLVLVVAWNTSAAAHPAVKTLAMLGGGAAFAAVLAGRPSAGRGEAGIVGGMWRGLTPLKKCLVLSGGLLTAAGAAVFLAPVFTVSARAISDTYMVSPASYFVPAPDHPLLGGLVPGSLVPGPDPLSGKMVYVGLTLTVLSLAGVFAGRAGVAGPGERGRGFFTALLAVSVFLLLPPVVRAGGLDIYMPVYFLHEAVPPFVDVRRVILLTVLAMSVLSGFALAAIIRSGRGRVAKAVACSLALILLSVEFYPALAAKDMSGYPAAYDWLAENGQGAVVEYPLTSIYDAGRYEPFYGQTIHGRPLVNPFAAVGHDPRPSNQALVKVLDRGGAASEPFANPALAASALAGLGVEHAVVRKDKTGIEARGLPGFELAADFPGSTVYRVVSEPSGVLARFTGLYRSGFFLNYLSKDDTGYRVENPYLRPAPLWDGPRAWLAAGTGATVEVFPAPGTSGVEAGSIPDYGLAFTARSFVGPALLSVTAEGGEAESFPIGDGPVRIRVRGLNPGGDGVTRVRLDLASGAARPETLSLPEGAGEEYLLGFALRDVRLVPTETSTAGPGPERLHSPGRLDGIYGGTL